MKYTAGFIGVGNMGGALLNAVSELIGGKNISVFDLDFQKATEQANKTGAIYQPLDKLVKESHYLFLGVKPSVVSQVCQQISKWLSPDNIIVSMAAGVDIAFISKIIASNRIIRIMPNTPAAVGEGVILYSIGQDVTDVEEKSFLDIMKKCGLVDKIKEELIDAAAAVSGCGPAFVYLFLEALADGADSCGLPREKAEQYAKQMVLGAAKLSQESEKHTGKLKDEVCSPAGTTIEGILSLEKGAFRYTVSSAVIESFRKTKELK
jgi:pyrroline-5-carboxylate reductase